MLGSVAGAQSQANRMRKSPLLAIGAVVALIATVPLFHVLFALVVTFVCVLTAAVLVGPRPRTRPGVFAPAGTNSAHRGADPAIGVGTVRAVADIESSLREPGERLITIDVEDVSGQKFAGQLRTRGGDPIVSALRPGVVVAVTFDPVTREQLWLADDLIAARAAFDQMLIRKGLATTEHLALIRRGTKSHGVVTAMHPTGAAREDYREVELDVMVSRPEGGQFPAHEVAFIPVSSVARVSPGSTIDAYYRPGDESAIAVCVSRT
jgi:hypothetical protein